MNQEELDEILKEHKLWVATAGVKGKQAKLNDTSLRSISLRDSDLRFANLRNTNLHGANLCSVDLYGVDLDFSCFPLWCGGKDWLVDDKLPRMLAAFICSMKCEDEEIKQMQKMLLPYARKSHRFNEILGESDNE